MPRISVILTSYNHAKYLREAIDSVLNQTFSDFEFIIWDDASTDGSWAIINEYNDPRIQTFLNQEQKGGIWGVNKAISEISQGEFIAIHHSDDIWEPEKLAKQVAYLDSHPEVGAVFTDVQPIDEDGEDFIQENHFYHKVFDQQNRTRYEWLRFFFLNGNALCQPSVLIRKRCYEECGLYRYDFAQLGDFDMWIRLCKQYEIYIIKEKLIKFRIRDVEANSSGNITECRVRYNYEFYNILNHYQTNIFHELLRIFPEALKYFRNESTNIKFALAMVCLDLGPYNWNRIMGLNLLFELIQNPATAIQLKKYYQFDYNTFIKLIGEYDIFGNNQIANLDNQIASMLTSTSWRVTRPMRLIREFFKKKVISKTDPKSRHYVSHDKTDGSLPVPDFFHRRKTVSLSNTAATGFNRNDYPEWVRRYDTLIDEKRAKMCSHIEGFSQKPLISVVMPTYNSKPEWLTEAIESVQKQIYPHWELCIADDSSTDSRIRPLLEKFARNDSRIKVMFREENGHISAASNSALELTSGEWVALLDHDDLLPEHALYWVAYTINQNPDIRLIYSDEDKINEAGNRLSPYFKCDWNPDLFYSQNMFCHLGVYQRELVEAVGGFRIGLEGSQDYDLVLRCIEQINVKQIHHIPRVLYHWRMHSESAAQLDDAKPYAVLAGERALNEHFSRLGIEARAKLIGHYYRVWYALPKKQPLVSLIIPTRNELALLRQCIESIIEKTTYTNYEILVVDNGSDDPDILSYFDSLSIESRIRIIRDDRAFNYSALNNAAVEIAKGELIGLINNDIKVISPEWLTEMVSHALRPEVGAVGASLWYPNDTLQHGGVVLGIGGLAGHSHRHFPKGSQGYVSRMTLISEFSAVTAACFVVRKSVYKQIGGLNENDLKVAFNDVDFCLRLLEAGYRNIWTPYAELYHYESATRGLDESPEEQARIASEVDYMKERWGKFLETDPSYSPNLTLDYEDFSYAWPPRIGTELQYCEICESHSWVRG